MSERIRTIDELTRAKQLFEAALMATHGITVEEENAALNQLLHEAITILDQGIDMAKRLRND